MVFIFAHDPVILLSVIVNNAFYFILGWLICSEFGHTARQLKMFFKKIHPQVKINGKTEIIESEPEERLENREIKSEEYTHDIEEEPFDDIGEVLLQHTTKKTSQEEIDDIFQSAVEQINPVERELSDEEILQIGIKKKSSVKIGGLFTDPSGGYATRGNIIEQGENMDKFKLNEDEKNILLTFFREKLNGKSYNEATKYLKQVEYKPQIVSVNGRPRANPIQNSVNVWLDINDQAYDTTRYNQFTPQAIVANVVNVG